MLLVLLLKANVIIRVCTTLAEFVFNNLVVILLNVIIMEMLKMMQFFSHQIIHF